MNADYRVTVQSYDEDADTFKVEVERSWGGADPRETVTVSGSMLPVMIREYGQPDELVGRSWEIKIS